MLEYTGKTKSKISNVTTPTEEVTE